jgi:hypothetical protein
MSCTAFAPSPTADATRLADPWRTSPAANTPLWQRRSSSTGLRYPPRGTLTTATSVAFSSPSTRSATVRLAPGATASAYVEETNVPPGNATSRTVYKGLLVTPMVATGYRSTRSSPVT